MFGNCFQQLHNTRIGKKQAWHLETDAAECRSERTSYNNKSKVTGVLDPLSTRTENSIKISGSYRLSVITSNRSDTIYMIGIKNEKSKKHEN